MTELQQPLDRSYGGGEEARTKAMWFTYRTGNRDLWAVTKDGREFPVGISVSPIPVASAAARMRSASSRRSS